METQDGRKRKAHTKSRRGCANCKLRRVKCDESTPQCDKCVQYGVQCSYEAPSTSTGAADGTQHSLQLPGEGMVSFSSKPRDSLSPDVRGGVDRDAVEVVERMLGAEVALHDTDEIYHLDRDDIATMRRFNYRTVCTIGTAQTVGIYREQVLKMASGRSSSLTHTVLALTLMHDRYLDKPWTTPPSSKEAFHFYHATALFNRSLSQPIHDEDRDPLWATAALTGCLTIASIDATRPEEAWPLCAESAADLDWLRMSDGKKAIWRLVDPLREGSVFREALTHSHSNPPTPFSNVPPELELLQPYLSTLFGVHDPQEQAPEHTANPYHTAASILVRLLNIECNHSSIMFFLSFLGHMDPRYRELLHAKDPRALVLLAWWYGKMSQYSVWWHARRNRLESQAICIYLAKHCGDDEDLVKLLDYPRIMSGLVA